jgi:serine/threonine-protein kinase
MLEIGAVVAGKLRIERVLGRGGMGVVAIATHLQLGTQVAIKMLHDELAKDPAIVARFLREARTPMQLRGDHVCRVLDVGTAENGAPYIVMELLQGADLAAVLAAAGPMSLAVAADYVVQACVALAEAHSLGIVHRDLKPANLFVARGLDGAPHIKVLDFGIAKAPDEGIQLTRTSSLLGSPGYMSPEQLRSARDVDARTDIWALGAILFQLVSGRLPFPADHVAELAMKVAVDPPQPLDVDPAFRAIVLRCLEKDRVRRYPDVVSLARDLAPWGSDSTRANAELIAKLLVRTGTQDTLLAGAGGRASSSAELGHAETIASLASGATAKPTTTLGGAAGQVAAPRSRRGIALGIGGALALGVAVLGGYELASRDRAVEPTTPVVAVAPAQVADAAMTAPVVVPVAAPTDAPTPAPPPIDAPIARRPPRPTAPVPGDAKPASGSDTVEMTDQEILKQIRDAAMQGDFEYVEKVALEVLAQQPNTQWAIYYVVVGACSNQDQATARKWAPKLTPQSFQTLRKVPCGSHDVDIDPAK